MDNLTLSGAVLTMSKAGLTNGSTTTFSFTANPLYYIIDGRWYSKATQTNATTPTTDGNSGAAFTAIPAGTSTAAYGGVFVWGINSAGTIKVYQGGIGKLSLAADGANCAFASPVTYPSVPGDVAVFGVTVVKVGTSGAAFTMGSTSLASGSNIAVSHFDIGCLPGACPLS